MLRLVGLFVLVLLAHARAAPPSNCLDITAFGAVVGEGHGVANGEAIAKAITTASSPDGDNCVFVPAGDFFTTAVHLTSNLTLNIAPEGRLLASVNRTTPALLNVVDVSDVTITGGGGINGVAERCIDHYSALDNRFQPYSGLRPHMIWMIRSQNVTVRDFSVHNSSNWNIRIDGCDGVMIDNVDVYGDSRFPNNDGIDPESSRDVTIINSAINVADDGVCPKASATYGELRNLLVRNTTIRSSSHAIKFGSNTDTDMYNILFDNITVWDSNSGLSIQQRSQGNIYNVTWSNINVETRYHAPRWWGNGGWATLTAEARNPGDVIGRTYNLSFINISAVTENGGLFSGRAHGIQNLLLDNVNVHIKHWSNYSTGMGPSCITPLAENVTCMGTRDYRPSALDGDNCSYYCREAGPAAGVALENVQGATVKDVSVTFDDTQEPWYGQCFTQDVSSTGVVQTGTACHHGSPSSGLKLL